MNIIVKNLTQRLIWKTQFRVVLGEWLACSFVYTGVWVVRRISEEVAFNGRFMALWYLMLVGKQPVSSKYQLLGAYTTLYKEA